MDHYLLDKYAEIAIKVGVNIQHGQRLLIGAPMLESMTPIEAAPLVRLLSTHAYNAGATLVEVIWGDDELRKIRLNNARIETMGELLDWQFKGFSQSIQNGDALLVILAHDPDILASCLPAALAKVQYANNKAAGPARKLIARGATNWTVITAPVAGWSKKVFPDLQPEEQNERMWDVLFDICRIKMDNPVVAWQEHINQLKKCTDHLNKKSYSALVILGKGTDLRIGLPQGHIWCSGSMTSQRGVSFISNIPTEEVFTLPHRDQIDGVVSSTRPLSYGGVLMDDFKLTFSQGKVVDLQAKQGEENLKKLLETDEGAKHLGEIALVPNSSPISRTNKLFYNTLIDENASSHLALGNAYNSCLLKGELMSNEEFARNGGNQSDIHIDFMFGTDDMDIDGLDKNGKKEAVMRSGEWAFKV